MDQCEGIKSLTEAQKNFEWFASEKFSMDKETWPGHLNQFKILGFSSAFGKFQSYEQLLKYEVKAVINFANNFITVSLNSNAVNEPVVVIGNMVNIHHYTKLVINATLVVGSLSPNIQFGTSR